MLIFGALEFELAPGSYTFVAIGNKLSANAGAAANAGGPSSFTFENSWLDPYEMTF